MATRVLAWGPWIASKAWQGYKLYRGGRSIKETWDTLRNPHATTPQKVIGVAKGALGAATMAGPILSGASVPAKFICSAAPSEKAINTVEFISNAAMSALSIEETLEEYFFHNRDKIPNNGRISILLLLLSQCLFATGVASEGISQFSREKTVRRLASFLIHHIPFAVTQELSGLYSEQQCIDLARLIITEFVDKLNALGSCFSQLSSLCKGLPGNSFFEELVSIPFCLQDFLNETLGPLSHAIFEMMLRRRSAAGPAEMPPEIPRAAPAPAAAAAVDIVDIAEDEDSREPTQEALLNLGAVEKFFHDNRVVVNQLINRSLPRSDQKRPLNAILEEALKNVLSLNSAAEFLLLSNHPGKIYVCALCQSEIVEPQSYVIYPSTNIVVSRRCFFEQLNPIYVIRDRALTRELFMDEYRLDEPTKLRRFRRAYLAWITTIFQSALYR